MIASVSIQAYTAANIAVAAALAGNTYTATGDRPAGEGGVQSDNVTLSDSGRLLSQTLLLPNPETIAKLSSELAGSMEKLFTAAGLPARPAVTFDVDPNTGHVAVHGDRPDIALIERMVNANPAVARRLHDLSAIASHAVALADAARASEAYSAARTPSQVERAIASYASIYHGQQHFAAITLEYDGKAVNINADGQPWPPVSAAA